MSDRPGDITEHRRALGASLAAWREASPLTQTDLGRRTHYSRTTISHIEAGRQFPGRDFWEVADSSYNANGALVAEYDRVCDLEERWRIGNLERTRAERRARVAENPRNVRDNSAAQASPLLTFRSVPVDFEYVDQLRTDVKTYVRLDQQHGGAITSPLIVQSFNQARHRIETAEIGKGLKRDAYSAIAEIAEVAGWSLYDAEQHGKAQAMNKEALRLARSAGDRSMELFVLQNMSMHASHLGHSEESLQLARLALESNLSPRLQSLFRLREARALAELGADADARRQFEYAKNLHSEGVADDDPHWSWWVDETEFAWHEGMVRLDLGDKVNAQDLFDRAADGISEQRVRTFYSYRASAFVVHAMNGSWNDAERSMTVLLDHVGLVGSRRGDTTVELGLAHLDRATAPGTVMDLASALRRALATTV